MVKTDVRKLQEQKLEIKKESREPDIKEKASIVTNFQLKD